MHCECRRIYTRAFGAISDSDWDVAFNYAYGQGWRVERDKGPIDRLPAWLTRVAYNAIVSEHRKTARVDLLADDEMLTEHAVADLADAVDDRQMLRDAIVCLRTTLPKRVRTVWTMRFAGDYEPDEIQATLGISRKAYEKDLEVGSRLIVSQLESARKSGVCDTPDMTSMVRAYAMWGEGHGAERAQVAREHLEQCPACRQTVRALRAGQRAAAFLPPPMLDLTAHHQPLVGAALQATDTLGGRIEDGLWRLTGRAHDGLLRIKHFMMNLVGRSPASGPVNTDRAATVLGAGSTGGAALATKAVAGCLAAGVLASGTGACLRAAGVGVPGLGGLIHSIIGSPHRKVHKSPSPNYAWTAPSQNLSALPSSTTMPGALTRPRIPSSHIHVVRKTTSHAPTSAMAARREFGSAASSTPPASPAEVSAARSEFSSPSHIARSASSTPSTPTQATPPSEPHTTKPSTKAAEGEFGGP